MIVEHLDSLKYEYGGEPIDYGSPTVPPTEVAATPTPPATESKKGGEQSEACSQVQPSFTAEEIDTMSVKSLKLAITSVLGKEALRGLLTKADLQAKARACLPAESSPSGGSQGAVQEKVRGEALHKKHTPSFSGFRAGFLKRQRTEERTAI